MLRLNNFFHLILIFLLLVSTSCTPQSEDLQPTLTLPPTVISSDTPLSYWVPSPSDSLQWQFSDYPVDLSIDADIFSIDLFETPQEIIDSLHEAGRRVICYINVGAWEEYRPDAEAFPDTVVGKKYIGWEGERWLNISNYQDFSGLISTRFDLAASKGCDGIEPDNINGFQQDTGFSITAEDQLAYNIWLSEQAHLRGLSIGIKNDNEQVADLVDHFDFALIEDCAVYDECADFLPFIEQGKAVFQVEYTDELNSTIDFCSTAIANGYSGIFKNRELDAWIKPCTSNQ